MVGRCWEKAEKLPSTPAKIPKKYERFAVDAQGNVSVDGNQVGTLRIVDFPQPQRLTKAGDTLFKPPADGTAEIPAEDSASVRGLSNSPTLIPSK